MFLIVAIVLLAGCNHVDSSALQALIDKGVATCTNSKDSKDCISIQNEIKNYNPTDEDLRVLKYECDQKEKRIACSYVAFFSRELNLNEQAISYARKACVMGDINACKTGFYLTTDIEEKLGFMDSSCRLGDTDSCSEKITLFIRAKRYKEAELLAISLCNKENAVDCYNLACLKSILGETRESSKFLLKAISLGFKDYNYIKNDIDLENLRKSLYWKNVRKEFK